MILEVCQVVSYEGQAAMMLQSLASTWSEGFESENPRYPAPDFEIVNSLEVLDPRRFLEWLLLQRSTKSQPYLASALHLWLADAAVALCEKRGFRQMVVGGGVFQNALLTSFLIEKAGNANISIYVPKQVPPGDGGLAYGQLVAFGRSGHVPSNSR